jgi:murein DD-endopeptidase MepM/ murein hydrolase activator NlpD
MFTSAVLTAGCVVWRMRVGTIMWREKAGWDAGRALRWGALTAVAVGAAACSPDTARFGGSYGTPYAGGPPPNQVAGAPGQPAPVGQIERQPLPQYQPAPQYQSAPQYQPTPQYQPAPQYQAPTPAADVTGTVPSASGGHWDWEGGTPVVVAQGETITSLSHRYKVPTQAIMQANKIANPAAIQPGQHLVIPRYINHGGPAKLAHAALPRNPSAPPAAAAPSGPSEHAVASGETLTSIAHRHRITVRELVLANNMTAEMPLKIGMKLTIPAKPGAVQVAKNAPGASAPAAAAPGKPQQVAQMRSAPTLQSIKTTEPPATARIATPATDAQADDSGPPGTAGMPSFRWPLRGRVVTNFGAKTSGGSNDGIDLAVPEGTAVRAADDGVVAYAGSELKGYGNLVLVRHANGFVTAYANASELTVKRNDQVHRGQVIAKSGQTGTAAAPQLHFEIRKNSAPVDPMQYLPSDKTASAPL